MNADLDAEVERIVSELDASNSRGLLRGRDDFRDAQLEISAGAGGTEAQDWASMLLRLYTRWCRAQ
ncbi:MAG: PCRF domain-containing protein [Gemmatimonas sp.]